MAGFEAVLKAELRSELTHCYRTTESGAVWHMRCADDGELLVFVPVVRDWKFAHAFGAEGFIGHPGPGCVGVWAHNKEVMGEHVLPLPCHDPVCNEAWRRRKVQGHE